MVNSANCMFTLVCMNWMDFWLIYLLICPYLTKSVHLKLMAQAILRRRGRDMRNKNHWNTKCIKNNTAQVSVKHGHIIFHLLKANR